MRQNPNYNIALVAAYFISATCATAQSNTVIAEGVAVYWANPRQLLGTAFTDSSWSSVDSGALKITIPTNAPLGSNAVVATGQTTGAVAIGKVIVE